MRVGDAYRGIARAAGCAFQQAAPVQVDHREVLADALRKRQRARIALCRQSQQ